MVDLLIELYTIDDSLILVGMMVSIAMLLGGMLVLTNISRLTFIGATFTTMVFLAFVELMRFKLLAAIDNPATLRPIVPITTMGLIYGFGLVVGAFIVHLARRPYRDERKRLEDMAERNGVTRAMLEIVEELG